MEGNISERLKGEQNVGTGEGKKKEFLDKVKKRPKALKKEERGDDFLLEGVTR